MNQKDLVSVIVPVRNGEKYVDRAAKDILRQTYCNLELIFVPNGCTDNTVALCQAWAEKDSRVRVFCNEENGLVLARKRGVQEAQGKYVLFHDVDDVYLRRYAIEKMHDAIVQDGTSVVQFGHVQDHFGFIRCRVFPMERNCTYDRPDMLAGKIKGIYIGAETGFDGPMWDKIYESKLVKHAFQALTAPITQQEDVLTNFFVFSDELFRTVSCRREAYYLYYSGIGVSAQADTGVKLLRDYCDFKPAMLARMDELGLDDELYMSLHEESIYCFRVIVRGYLEKWPHEKLLDFIREVNEYEYIHSAKAWFNSHTEYLYDELRFLCSDYTPEEYYDYCKKTKPKTTLKQRAINIARKLLK